MPQLRVHISYRDEQFSSFFTRYSRRHISRMSHSVFICCLGLVLYLATPTSAVLADEEKAELIQAHNFYRSKVQPTATDMVAMVSEERGGGEREGRGGE